MFFTLQEGGKTVYTHISLVDESKQEQIHQIYNKESTWKNTARFFTFWGTMELVNRISLLKSQNIFARAAIVAIPTLAAGSLGQQAYWSIGGNWNKVKSLLVGVPVYQKMVDVPELDKLFFILDDDKNYQPSLNHHAVTQGRKYYKLFENN
ncbi:hypothetical protein IMG5_163230 [Ichthyophthirius multifiliis]|uniref:Uncharacterized protein n=1 Tax=Ichthyophthirius multifiliis TaxID=5932 RepID=G0R0B4_ICHMU|nr:hypothetical protein IMG5_163230 [Ichthyophthirius multifiliis]EGR29092.1 hypothetical protein IMG5_163230 [Ichthyophthirius multifiliis]|eukprot:XP_004030328.1 hypothetical protein IMG5_163230 [Ichthyophthirius multifiliis]